MTSLGNLSEESQEFFDLLKTALTGLDPQMLNRLVRFRELVVEENQKQNLTRLVSPQAFLEGHVIDVVYLLQSKFVEFPAVDLGSGAGVPGIIAAIIGNGQWVLVESEKRKAEFLRVAAEILALEQVSVVPMRIEDYLKRNPANSIVVRAVGPIGRIYQWIRKCSTWNNLVLLKGPGWEAEWEEFKKDGRNRGLRIEDSLDYSVGSPAKQRVIVKLARE